MGRARRAGSSEVGQRRGAGGALRPIRQGATPEPANLVRDRLAVGGVAVLSLLASVSFMVGRGRIPFTSDQAVPALMAIDIRDHGSHPVFHWGVFYNGSLEPHLLSFLFRVLPAGVSTYRLFLALLLTATVLLVGETCRRAWGVRAGIVASLTLGLGPSFFFYKGLTSDGAYTSVVTALAAALLAATRTTEGERPGLAPIAALGFFTGLAWWIQPISAAFAPVVALAMASRPRAWARPLPLGVLAGSLLCGSAPWWIENVRMGFPSLRMPELAAATKSGALSQAVDLLTHGWPMLLGARSARSDLPTVPGAAVFAVALVLGLCALALGRLRLSPRGSPAFLLVASVALVAMPPILALSIARTDLRADVRFLIPSYLGLAPLVAFAVEWLVGSGRRALVPVLGIVLGALGPASQLQAPRLSFDAIHAGMLRESSEAAVALRRQGYRDLYGSYWLTYRLAFLGRGDLVPASFGQATDGVVRNEAFQRAADASANPAFLLNSLDGARLAAFARSRGWTANRTTLPALGLAVVTDLPPEALAIVRRCRCIPAAVGPASLEWIGIEGPPRIRQGEWARYRVSFQMIGPAPTSTRVRFAPRWRAEYGSVFGRNEQHSPFPRALRSGERLDTTVPVNAFVDPGRYVLSIDLVEDEVKWTEWRGPSLAVEVVP
ncbi:MAG: hypothetical protein HY900_05250 [Deltaproteobacteria bacterium]|nr:hypothetical protein [Deltaproteobacteria bacterium]